MTTATSRRSIRRRLLDEIPLLGFYGTADSVAAGNIVDTYAFQDSNLSIQHFRGCYIYRPGLTGDDAVKKAGNLTLASGTLAHTGSNYSNTTDTNYEIIGVLHPDELNACIQRALMKIYFESQVPLTLIADGDMSAAAAGSWTSSNANLTKITTAANVFSGLRSLRVANTGGAGYAESGTVNVSRGEPVWLSAVGRADVGTANLILYDNTTSTTLATVTSTQEQWFHMYWTGNVGSTTEIVTVRLQGTEANADIYWDHVILRRLYDFRIPAPSWLDEPFKFLKLRQAEYGNTVESYVHSGQSRYFKDWYQPKDFTLDPFHPEANAYAVQLQRVSPQADLWIEGKRPFYDLETLAADTDTTTAPLEQVVAYTKRELADLLVRRFPGDEKWNTMRAQATMDVAAETMSRPEIPMQPIKRSTIGRI